MFKSLENQRTRIVCRILTSFVCLIFTSSTIMPMSLAQAQAMPMGRTVLNLPVPGMMVATTDEFQPTIIKGLTFHPENPLELDFIVDQGDEKLQPEALRKESLRMIKYFLAALTVPKDQMWVNLSPNEPDRIIPEGLGQTEMGRDMLAQDYLLKQLTSSLMYPEDEIGQAFWDRVHEKAYAEYGVTDIPVDSFNKVWIVPDKAVVYEHETNAFVVARHLKVMLEEDYLAASNNVGAGLAPAQKSRATTRVAPTTSIIREILIPEIEREVNEGKTFAKLRQIYNSMILALWYKKNLKESLISQVYVDKNKTLGVDVEDKAIKHKIYNQYLEAFKKGVYDTIKEDYDPATQQIIPRKYFSGGATAPKEIIGIKDLSMMPQLVDQSEMTSLPGDSALLVNAKLAEMKVSSNMVKANQAMVAVRMKREITVKQLAEALGFGDSIAEFVDGLNASNDRPITEKYLIWEGDTLTFGGDLKHKLEAAFLNEQLDEAYDESYSFQDIVLLKIDTYLSENAGDEDFLSDEVSSEEKFLLDVINEISDLRIDLNSGESIYFENSNFINRRGVIIIFQIKNNAESILGELKVDVSGEEITFRVTSEQLKESMEVNHAIENALLKMIPYDGNYVYVNEFFLDLMKELIDENRLFISKGEVIYIEENDEKFEILDGSEGLELSENQLLVSDFFKNNLMDSQTITSLEMYGFKTFLIPNLKNGTEMVTLFGLKEMMRAVNQPEDRPQRYFFTAKRDAAMMKEPEPIEVAIEHNLNIGQLARALGLNDIISMDGFRYDKGWMISEGKLFEFNVTLQKQLPGLFFKKYDEGEVVYLDKQEIRKNINKKIKSLLGRHDEDEEGFSHKLFPKWKPEEPNLENYFLDYVERNVREKVKEASDGQKLELVVPYEDQSTDIENLDFVILMKDGSHSRPLRVTIGEKEMGFPEVFGEYELMDSGKGISLLEDEDLGEKRYLIEEILLEAIPRGEGYSYSDKFSTDRVRALLRELVVKGELIFSQGEVFYVKDDGQKLKIVDQLKAMSGKNNIFFMEFVKDHLMDKQTVKNLTKAGFNNVIIANKENVPLNVTQMLMDLSDIKNKNFYSFTATRDVAMMVEPEPMDVAIESRISVRQLALALGFKDMDEFFKIINEGKLREDLQYEESMIDKWKFFQFNVILQKLLPDVFFDKYDAGEVVYFDKKDIFYDVNLKINNFIDRHKEDDESIEDAIKKLHLPEWEEIEPQPEDNLVDLIRKNVEKNVTKISKDQELKLNFSWGRSDTATEKKMNLDFDIMMNNVSQIRSLSIKIVDKNIGFPKVSQPYDLTDNGKGIPLLEDKDLGEKRYLVERILLKAIPYEKGYSYSNKFSTDRVKALVKNKELIIEQGKIFYVKGENKVRIVDGEALIPGREISFTEIFKNRFMDKQTVESLTAAGFNNVEVYLEVFGVKDLTNYEALFNMIATLNNTHRVGDENAFYTFTATRDVAMKVKVAAGDNSFRKGGIDFNPDTLDFQILRDGNGVPLPVFRQPIANINIDGFLPVIINIQPITPPTMQMLLGLDRQESPFDATQHSSQDQHVGDLSWFCRHQKVSKGSSRSDFLA